MLPMCVFVGSERQQDSSEYAALSIFVCCVLLCLLIIILSAIAAPNKIMWLQGSHAPWKVKKFKGIFQM